MFLLVVFDARDCAPERNMTGFLMDREVQLGLAAKNEAVGRASIVEHSQLFATFHPFALLDGDLAGRHLNHAHCDEAHQSNIRVVGFDEDEGPGGDNTEVCLGGSENGIIVPQGWRESIISSWHNMGLDDRAGDRAMPTVIIGSGKESLINGATTELVCEWVVVEHVPQRIILFLEPEFVVFFHIASNAIHGGLAGTVDHVRVIGEVEGAHALAEGANEEMIPGDVAVVRLVGFTFEGLCEVADVSFK